MSLAFLCKKGWHTASIQNQERVWIAEQRDLMEKRKMAEIQKELEEERQVLNLRKMREEASGDR